MYPGKNWLRSAKIAKHQGQVLLAIMVVFVEMQLEFPKARGQSRTYCPPEADVSIHVSLGGILLPSAMTVYRR